MIAIKKLLVWWSTFTFYWMHYTLSLRKEKQDICDPKLCNPTLAFGRN